eukprot:2171829-Prorocentrum_lima.AAC.1
MDGLSHHHVEESVPSHGGSATARGTIWEQPLRFPVTEEMNISHLAHLALTGKVQIHRVSQRDGPVQ